MSMRLILMVATIYACAVGWPAMAELNGGYRGVDEAQGMRLEFARDGDRLTGVLTDTSGVQRPFDADILESGAETVIEDGGGRLYMLFTEEPLGVTALAIPMIGNDALVTNQTRALVFIADGVTAPPRPQRYIPPPAGPGGVVDPRGFVESYSFWPSRAVANGYESVRGRYRTLIRLHAVVQTDIVWKMCRSGARSAGLADALRGQGTTCDQVLAAFGRMMQGGAAVAKFNAFRRDVEAQKAALVEAIRCSIDYRRSDPACKRAGARVARAAVSLETVATVLRRY